MHAALGSPGLLFRFLIAGMTAMLVVTVMSTAAGFVLGNGNAITGGFIQAEPITPSGFVLIEIVVGVVTFLGSFYVLSKK